MIFEFDLLVPRFGMNLQPLFTFVFPLIEQARWHCIRESKRDEIDGALLLPMRQAIFACAGFPRTD